MVGNLGKKKRKEREKKAHESEAALESMTVPSEMGCSFLNQPSMFFQGVGYL